MSTADVALRLQGLTKSFKGHLSLGRTQVLRGLDLSVSRGEIYGFIGGNGAGKTTTMKIITGLVHADAGTVSLLGRPARDPEARRSLGFLPEHPAFHGHLSGREFLEFHGRLLGMESRRRHQEVERVLQETGMASRADTPLRKCSKGMTQRIGIAQAILGEPALLILDEPMSGLDPAGRRDVRDLILAQRRRGATVFFSSHILTDAEMLCDRIGILKGGKLVLEGELATLLAGGTSSWEAGLSGAGAAEIQNGFHLLSRQGDRLLLEISGEAELSDLLERVRQRGVRLDSLVPRRHSLENRFLDVVGRGEDGA